MNKCDARRPARPTVKEVMGRSARELLIDHIDLRSLLENILEQSCIHEYLNSLLKPTSVSNGEGPLWLQWAKSRNKLKVVSCDIPAGILPTGMTGKLHDVKVFVKYGPDDAVYDSDEELRNKVARGNCFLETCKGSDKEVSCIIYGLKKFTGGLGDDDDCHIGDNHSWKRYFTKPLESASHVICTRKANGEAAHLSAGKVNGELLICAGSKNVHMLMKDRADIAKYVDARFSVAREVSSAVFDMLDEIGEEKRQGLLEFLSETQLVGIFELLNPNHQHVEELSHLKTSKLQFITWVSRGVSLESTTELCRMPPHIAIEVARAFGIGTVEYETIPATDVDNRMVEIRRGYGYEGEVLYFVDGANKVIGLLKKKSIWYIVCRAIREKLRKACTQNHKNSSTFSIGYAIAKVERRIEEIQMWLGLDETSTKHWKELGGKCIRWCIYNQDNGHLTVHDMTDRFPVTWNKFLRETDQTDRVTSQWSEPQGSDE